MSLQSPVSFMYSFGSLFSDCNYLGKKSGTESMARGTELARGRNRTEKLEKWVAGLNDSTVQGRTRGVM